jgi:hypothetical protein
MGNQSSMAYLTVSQLKSDVCPSLAPSQLELNDINTTWQSETSYVHDAGAIDLNTSDNMSGLTDQYSGLEVTEPITSQYQQIATILYSRVIVVVCAFGAVGNIFNLLILVPKGIRCSLGRIEQFSYTGLVALAVSDLLFCLVVLPHGFLDMTPRIFDKVTFTLLYQTYSSAIINMFMLCSTWLTVVLALGRYLAICYPLKAREVFGMTFAKRSLLGVVTSCILLNLPRFWEFYVAQIQCDDGEIMYFKYYSHMKLNVFAFTVYMWSYFIFAILVPFLFLLFCNWYLACALHRAQHARRQMRAVSVDVTETNTMMTLVLVIVVIMYILLVSPAELINFLRLRYIQDTESFNLAVAAVNTLQAINFAVNFVLYYVINKSFRKSFISLVTCRWRHGRRKVTRRYSSVSSAGQTRC